MISSTYTTTHNVYRSERFPELSSERDCDRATIEWLDANPIAHKIVSARSRSAVFGPGSSTYLGCSDGAHASAVLYRASVLHACASGESVPGVQSACASDSIFAWRARFTLEHYADKGFTGGLFLLWDGTYERNCLVLDYTPSTLEDVAARFLAWCDPYYEKRAVLVKRRGKEVWRKDAQALAGRATFAGVSP